ncbi:MAG: Gldg family protein [Betaproteobacteria bacterium]|nr:Gldg family protein [Betaproteobacteria bacterium]
MNKKYLESIFYSAGGVAALVVILIAANFLLGTFNARVDLTQGSVYTLSQGTKSILGKLEAPVKIRLYFSQSSSTVPVGLKTFAKRVEDLLREFERAGGGKVVIEKLNPEPDSEAEDSAALDGIEGQLTNTQEKFYLGLAVSFLDQKAALPVLAPDREQLLEYDITRAITRVASTAKPVVGIMSALPVLGRPLNPMLKQQPTEPWVLATELQNIFTVKKVELNAEKIPDDIKVLLVIHPRDVSETTEYALDQFILRGGKMIAFLDSYAYFDQQPDMQNPLGGNAAGQSTFYRLLKHWGLGMEMGKVVGDLTYASGAGPRILPTLLSLSADALNKDDVVMSQLGTMLIPFASAFTGKPAEGLTQTVLAQSSPNAMLVDLIIATLSGEPSTRGFQPAGTPYPLAIRLTGKFKTAFPEGKPKPYERPAQAKKQPEAKTDEVKAEPQLKESAQENSVVLVSDVDLLTDGAAVEVQEVFGQRLIGPRNGNLNLAQSLVEQVSGDFDLTKLRSRAAFTRPLTVIQQMEARAQQSYLGKIKELEDNLQQTQEKLTALQKGRAGAQSTLMSPEQQAEVENFKKKTIETRRDLKELRKNLRVESEALQFWTKVVNIGMVPLLVTLLGLGLALARRRRTAAK